MIGDEEVDDFLEHHGVLGMKWGRRKGGSSSSSPKSPRPGSWPTLSKSDKRKAVGIIVGVTAATATISIGAALIMNKRDEMKRIKMKNLKTTASLATPFLAKYGNTPMTVWHQPGPFQISQHLR